jgi:hypothetical protein
MGWARPVGDQGAVIRLDADDFAVGARSGEPG